MAEKFVKRLKDAGMDRARIEGVPACDWVLIDAEDVIVHLFRPEVRKFYNLERIWSETARAPVRTDKLTNADAPYRRRHRPPSGRAGG